MKVEIEKIYRDENFEVRMAIKCVEPKSPPYNEVCTMTDSDMRRHRDAEEKYKRELKRYEKELNGFFLGEAEVTRKW